VAALRHYFTQHIQISLLVYWALLGAFHIYRMFDRSRLRDLHAVQFEAQLTEAHLMALRNQLQPHFLFNTLQAATTLLHDDPRGAQEILLSLSDLLRQFLQALQQQEVSVHREIEFVKCYAAIHERRFGDRLRFDFQIDERVQWFAVPSLLLQPLVKNAIRHGIGERRQPDVVSISAFLNRDRLNLEVRNGASVLDDLPERLMSRGVGLTNTRNHPEIDVLTECGDGLSAVNAILACKPKLVFLDVQMPELDGFAVVRRIVAEQMPATIFVTAYDHHTLAAFEANALDYLLKPFGQCRVDRALNRAREPFGGVRGSSGGATPPSNDGGHFPAAQVCQPSAGR
jgi:CheY-like chemotaxis protein